MATLTIRNSSCVVPTVNCVEYGYLYNWYVATDTREISSSDEWTVPTEIQLDAFASYLGNSSIALKQEGTTYWTTGDGTNVYGFNARGGGERKSDGVFVNLKVEGNLWSSTLYGFGSDNSEFLILGNNGTLVTPTGGNDWTVGHFVRLVSDATGVADGETTAYIGNDGKTYSAIAINELYWIQYNLAETQYRNGDPIPTVEDNTTWAGLTTGAKCAYNNTYSYVGCDESYTAQSFTYTGNAAFSGTTFQTGLTYPQSSDIGYSARYVIEDVISSPPYEGFDQMWITGYTKESLDYILRKDGVEIQVGDVINIVPDPLNPGLYVFESLFEKYVLTEPPAYPDDWAVTLIVRFLYNDTWTKELTVYYTVKTS